MALECEFCGNKLLGRRFSRRHFETRHFCSISCVSAFEGRYALPTDRIYETRPGWSWFPAVLPDPV